MWPKAYRDYPVDKPLVKDQVEPTRGIIGCEMHDLNGWGTTLHVPREKWKELKMWKSRMTQRGEHTWDLVQQYHACPKCGFIIESRQDYKYHFGKYQKDIECQRCHFRFTVTKPLKPRFGPFFGEPEPVEINWD